MLSLNACLTGLALVFIVHLSAVCAEPQALHRQKLLSPIATPSSGDGYKVAFFDADSTLRVSKAGNPSANSPQDYLILPGVAQELKRLNDEGYLVAIVSNQAGIPRHISMADADAAIFNMIMDFKALGVVIHYFDFAENNDQFRKPNTGMKHRLEEVLKDVFGNNTTIDLSRSFMVGDSGYAQEKKGKPADIRPDGRPGFNFSNSDRGFAENLNIPFFEPQIVFGWIKYGVEKIEKPEDLELLNKKMAGCPGLTNKT